MNSAKISVIIPNFNNSFWLKKCIYSCIQQKGDFLIEIIVVDDFSDDDSETIIKSLQSENPDRIKYFKNTIKGGNNARRLGFEHSTGDFIQWLDSDDLILEGKFKQQTEFLIANPQVDIVYSDWLLHTYQNEELVLEEKKQESSRTNFLEDIIHNKWQPPLSYFLRRKAAEKLAKIDAWHPERKVGQDREYFTMAAIHGLKFGYTPGFFSVYNRWNRNSVSSLNQKERLLLNLSLEKRFIDEITKQEHISAATKRTLLSILKTDSLITSYYYPKVSLCFPMNWNEIYFDFKSWKVKFILPLLWFIQKIKYPITHTQKTDLR